jgi:hypothetical protein
MREKVVEARRIRSVILLRFALKLGRDEACYRAHTEMNALRPSAFEMPQNPDYLQVSRDLVRDVGCRQKVQRPTLSRRDPNETRLLSAI